MTSRFVRSVLRESSPSILSISLRWERWEPSYTWSEIIFISCRTYVCARPPYTCGHRWERVRLLVPPRSGDELVPHGRVPLAAPRRTVSGSHETWDRRYSSQSRRFAMTDSESPLVEHPPQFTGWFVTRDCISDRVWINRCESANVSYVKLCTCVTSHRGPRGKPRRNRGHVKSASKRKNKSYLR